MRRETSLLFHIGIPVAQDENRGAVLCCLEGILRQFVERGLECAVVVERERHRREVRHVLEAVQLVVGEDRAGHLDEARVLRRLVEDVRLVADVRHDRHHELLADRIDRRVRHLCEKLVEEVEQRAALP